MNEYVVHSVGITTQKDLGNQMNIHISYDISACSLVPRPLRAEKRAWYPLLAHAPNSSANSQDNMP